MLSTEQRFVVCLLIGLIFLNDPLFAETLYTSSSFFPISGVVFFVSFAALLSLSALVFIDGILIPQERRTFLFLVPKIIFCLILWGVVLTFYCWHSVLEWLYPFSRDFTDIPFYEGFLVIIIGFSILYCIWLIQIFCRIVTTWAILPLSTRIRCIFIVAATGVLIAVTGVMVLLLFYAEYVLSAIIVGSFTSYNSYVFLIAFYLSPHRWNDDECDVGIHREFQELSFGDDPDVEIFDRANDPTNDTTEERNGPPVTFQDEIVSNVGRQIKTPV